jgi:hypothetical protein
MREKKRLIYYCASDEEEYKAMCRKEERENRSRFCFFLTKDRHSSIDY